MCVYVLDGLTHSLIFPDSEKKPVKGPVHNPTSVWSGLHIYPSTLSVHTQLVCLCMHIEKDLKISDNEHLFVLLDLILPFPQWIHNSLRILFFPFLHIFS